MTRLALDGIISRYAMLKNLVDWRPLKASVGELKKKTESLMYYRDQMRAKKKSKKTNKKK